MSWGSERASKGVLERSFSVEVEGRRIPGAFWRPKGSGDAPGLSMGTMMGLPLVAALDEIRVALLGLMGIWGPNGDRLQAEAPRVACPVRFLVQWDDEIVPRDTALALFARIGSATKTLHGNPGRHVEVPPDEMRDSAAFLARHLARPLAG